MTVHETGKTMLEEKGRRPHSEEMRDRLDGIRNDGGEGGRLQ